MSIVLKCPGCGKRYALEDSSAGQKVRCVDCNQAFRVPGGSPGSGARPGSEAPTRQGANRKSPGSSSARARSQAEAIEEPVDLGDSSWLDEGDLPPQSTPQLVRRERTTAAGSGPPLGLLIGLGAAGVILVGLVVGLLVMSTGSSSRPKPADNQAKAGDAPAPGLMERIIDAATGSANDSTDVASYPSLGALPPPLLPPPAPRDLSAHERQQRIVISFIGRMNDILASVHDVPSMQAAGQQLKNLGGQADQEMRQAAPPFRLTAAENAELTRRMASDIRKEVARAGKESLRIAGVPGLGIAGTQLLSLVTRLSLPLEQALKMAESFKAQTGPEPYAEVYVKLDNEDAEIVFRQKLRALLGEIPSMQWTHRSDYKLASYRVWPVDDVHWFSEKITFGKATVKAQDLRGSESRLAGRCRRRTRGREETRRGSPGDNPPRPPGPTRTRTIPSPPPAARLGDQGPVRSSLFQSAQAKRGCRGAWPALSKRRTTGGGHQRTPAAAARRGWVPR